MSSRPLPYHTAKTLRSVSDLVEAGLVRPEQAERLDKVAERYGIAIPSMLAALIDPSDPNDPIARQFVPSARELIQTADELTDPIGDDAHSPLPGVVHRYPDRVLLKPVLVCPVYCRFCFRREQVGDADATLSENALDAALDYIADAPQVREVILTGGDPLMLGAERIAKLSSALASIPHLDVVRWHSRIPVADPERITPALVRALAVPFETGKAAWLSVHVNHPRELAAAAVEAIGRLRQGGLTLVAQTVLLNGVNDQAPILEALFRSLVRLGVKPYYLHHPDLAPGTGHFRLKIAQGQALVRALKGRLSGIAQPTYVLDIPGGAGKSALGPDCWDAVDGTITDWRGIAHDYRE